MGDIFDFIDLTGAFDETLARHYFKQLIDGLAFCHEREITHRDLKPENLLIDKKLNLRISDFGFAGPLKGRPEAGEKGLTTILGTPGFMAPELLKS